MSFWSTVGDFVATASDYADTFADVAGNVSQAFSYFDGGNTASSNGGNYWSQWLPQFFPQSESSYAPKPPPPPPSKSVSSGFVSDGAVEIVDRPASFSSGSSSASLLLLAVVGVGLVVWSRK